MKQYLMTIAIGPVQGFIAAARRLRDLWFGSYLLSELAKKGALSLYQHGAELIFPAQQNAEKELFPGSDMRVPNKLFVKLTADKPDQVFKSVKEDIVNFWKYNLALKTVEKDRKKINLNLFNDQIEDFLEIYGVWTQINGDYEGARERIDQLLAARKTLRNFNQTIPIQTGKGGLPKSSLDGVRESVLNDHLRNKGKSGLKEGEELDAVGWVKRYGRKIGDVELMPTFESLSDLAADPFLRGTINNLKAIESMQMLANVIIDSGVDITRVTEREHRKPLLQLSPRILFPNSLRKDLEHAGVEPTKIKSILRKVRNIHLEAGEKQGPLPYTAILLGDGDNMGKAINSMKSEKSHQSLSAELDRFARSCEIIVTNNHGSLIYSGGDDVMAFVPLDRVIECANALQHDFSSKVKRVEWKEKDIPTLSVGVAIVHHLNPMNLSLNLARKAERLAKSNKGKNAVALILDKRGGVPIELCAGWNEGIAERLIQWTLFHQKEQIPDKFGYQLKHLSREFGKNYHLAWTIDGQPDNALAYEFIRILQRKREEYGRRELKKETLEQILHTAQHVNSVEQLAKELILTRLIADAKCQARGIKEKFHERN